MTRLLSSKSSSLHKGDELRGSRKIRRPGGGRRHGWQIGGVDDGTRRKANRGGRPEVTLTADRVFVNVGTHATIPDTPGLREAKPMTHIEALDLQRRPEHLIVLGGGYVGLELSQALRRLGSSATLITRHSQLAANEDSDVSEAVLQLFRDEGIEVLLNTDVLRVGGISGGRVSVELQSGKSTRTSA
jgi:pyruvate/2-oxoglutarate dehydrogenase complex dihydrolipoamide dehydrogenase (E3) component